LAEQQVARLIAERNALDRRLARCDQPAALATVDALKLRAELVRSIAQAEATWFAAEEALEHAAREQQWRSGPDTDP
jgi:hypothetical protein